MSIGLKTEIVYPLQEAVLAGLQAMRDAQFNSAKLCGGTALSRCWLEQGKGAEPGRGGATG